MAERDAPAFKDRAASKEAAMLQQMQQLEGMSQGRREDPRKLQIAESMAKEAEEKQAQEETFRRQSENACVELGDARDAGVQSIAEDEAKVGALSEKLDGAESLNVTMAERARKDESMSSFLKTEKRMLQEELATERKRTLRTISYTSGDDICMFEAKTTPPPEVTVNRDPQGLLGEFYTCSDS